MTLLKPLWMQDNAYSALEDRQLVLAVGDDGVLSPNALKVVQRAAGANMTVEVGPGRAIIPGASGSYLCGSDAVETLAIDAAPSPGTSRIDVVYAEVRDAQATGVGSDNDWRFGVAKGTPSASPVAPSAPAHAIGLARVTLTSSTTSITNGIITDVRRHSASAADRRWPVLATVDLTGHTVNTTADTWGEVVVPAPNRPVKVVADVVGQFACGAGETNRFGELAVRLTYGVTTSTPQGLSGRSDDALDSVPIVNGYTWTVTPGTGEDLVVAARVRAVAAGTVEFSNGHLRVQVFPA